VLLEAGLSEADIQSLVERKAIGLAP